MSDTPPVEVHVDDPNKNVEPPHVEVHTHNPPPVPATPNVDEAEVTRLREENERLRNDKEEFRNSILEEVQRKLQEGIEASRQVVGEVVNDAVSAVPEVEVSQEGASTEPPVSVEIEEEPAPAKREHWFFRQR